MRPEPHNVLVLLASLSEKFLTGQKLRVFKEEIILQTLVTKTVKVLLVKGLYRRWDGFYLIVRNHDHKITENLTTDQ